MNLENSLYKVVAQDFHKKISVPTSKSFANRALILGALIGDSFKISHLPTSTDVTFLIKAFEKVGLQFKYENNAIEFFNSFPACEENVQSDSITLETGDGGTTNRFLIAMLSRGKKTYYIKPSGKIAERPNDELFDILKSLRVKIDILKNESAWICVKGPIQFAANKKVEIDCGQSTQFATALKLACHNLPIKFDLVNLNSSLAYNQLTDELLNRVKSEKNFCVPVDFSSASYPLALAQVSGEVIIENCHELDPFQADSEFFHILKSIGSDIKFTKEGLFVSNKTKLKPFVVDGSNCLDLIMTLVFLATQIEGSSKITHLKLLKYKESDRLSEIFKTLNAFKVRYNYNEENDELEVFKMDKIHEPISVSPAPDHRMVMMNYLLLRINGGGMLSNTEHIKKSFPDFIKIMENA